MVMFLGALSRAQQRGLVCQEKLQRRPVWQLHALGEGLADACILAPLHEPRAQPESRQDHCGRGDLERTLSLLSKMINDALGEP